MAYTKVDTLLILFPVLVSSFAGVFLSQSFYSLDWCGLFPISLRNHSGRIYRQESWLSPFWTLRISSYHRPENIYVSTQVCFLISWGYCTKLSENQRIELWPAFNRARFQDECHKPVLACSPRVAEDGAHDAQPLSRSIDLANHASPRLVHLPRVVHSTGVEPVMSVRTSRLQRAGFAGSH